MTRSRLTLASAGLPLAFLLLNASAKAQDTHYAPHGSVQQFSAPDCFIESWLAGAERKIALVTVTSAINYRIQVDPIRFHPAADDGPGQIFL